MKTTQDTPLLAAGFFTGQHRWPTPNATWRETQYETGIGIPNGRLS